MRRSLLAAVILMAAGCAAEERERLDEAELAAKAAELERTAHAEVDERLADLDYDPVPETAEDEVQ